VRVLTIRVMTVPAVIMLMIFAAERVLVLMRSVMCHPLRDP
jgi:hypothetical protein